MRDLLPFPGAVVVRLPADESVTAAADEWDDEAQKKDLVQYLLSL